jgi:hypothetical protein
LIGMLTGGPPVPDEMAANAESSSPQPTKIAS